MKKYIIVGIILFINVALIIILQFIPNNQKIREKDFNVEKLSVLELSKSEKQACIDQLVDYLNKEEYISCKSIRFLNNTIDSTNNATYFYVVIGGYDDSLIEIENKGNKKFEYSYLGNVMNKNFISEKTGVTYLQITDPSEYKKQQELQKIIENSKYSQPDATDNVVIDPADGGPVE